MTPAFSPAPAHMVYGGEALEKRKRHVLRCHHADRSQSASALCVHGLSGLPVPADRRRRCRPFTADLLCGGAFLHPGRRRGPDLRHVPVRRGPGPGPAPGRGRRALRLRPVQPVLQPARGPVPVVLCARRCRLLAGRSRRRALPADLRPVSAPGLSIRRYDGLFYRRRADPGPGSH